MYYYCHIKCTLIIYSTRLCECRSITDSIQIKGFTWKSINNDPLNNHLLFLSLRCSQIFKTQIILEAHMSVKPV